MIKGILKKIAGSAIKAFAGDVLGLVNKNVALTPQQQNEFALALEALEIQHKKIENDALIQAETTLTDRIATLEGTASDLGKSWLGKCVLFLRGAQRPVWGYSVLVLDFCWLIGGAKMNEMQEQTLFGLNILLLSFLFGERAVRNVLPIFKQAMNKQPA